MFEFSVARKYLIPRVRQLSVSIISLISIFVIATVVWLSIVFFSAQEGIERSWTEKMVALTSPIRLTPTQDYYKSYYYQIDAYASHSNYAHKSLREKLASLESDPYDPANDPGLPRNFPKKEPVDIVKATMKAVGPSGHIFETAQANLTVRLIRDISEQEVRSTIFLTGFEDASRRLKQNIDLPKNGIVLPKAFQDAGIEVGDEGFITYHGFGATAAQELRSKIKVAGFYDPGILPVGGKVALIHTNLLDQVLSANFSEGANLPTGIAVDVADIKQAHAVKEAIQSQLEKDNLSRYWTIQTYDEFDFTKDIFQQMKSDKNLFSLISIIITIVACSNIISMLIILVHDKRKEIAVLRALGASKSSIACIFGLCGFLLGAVGSILGAILAVLTLKNLHTILSFLGRLQGFEVLSSTFYANSLPNEVSLSSLFFVICIAGVASCLAGMVPAIQASRINTSEALRNE
ncbi:MAG: FtsX-like permease family protein [Verrucomicrobia bacterium]|nr:FtsX-like permease family protein [Verrucomicrobiota bacterium]MBS0637604.1 FtsX-like permease family protein [Verrucomicrobiota bacterium]